MVKTWEIGTPMRHLFPMRWALLPVLSAAAVIGVLAVAVPLMSGATGSDQVAVDSSSAPGYSPVVMGVDGVPGSATATTGSGGPSSPVEGAPSTAAPGTATTRPGTSTAAPAGPATSSPGQAVLPGTTAPSAGSPDGTPSSTPGSTAPDTTSSSPSASDAPAPRTPDVPVTDAVLVAIDRARAAQNCSPLQADDTLAAAALTNSALMAAQDTVDVLASAGSAAAVAAGPDAATVVATWLADPADSARLLDCSFTSAGVGETPGPGGPWWTLFLA